MKKAIKKVASGLVRDAEKSWFAELSDKVKCTKTHIYYAMKNCNGDPDVLRNYIINIVDHYQGNHSKCHQDSRCKEVGYVCSKKPLVSERAIAAYRKAVEGTTVFKNVYYSNDKMFQCNFKICPMACQEIFIDYDKPAIAKKRKK